MSVPRWEVEYPTYRDEIINHRAGYAPTWALPTDDDDEAPLAPLVLRDCGNPTCAHRSYALYCSTYCLEMMEPEVVGEVEEEAMEPAAPVATRAPKAYYAILAEVEGCLAKIEDRILFFAWESGAITRVESWADLIVLGEMGTASCQNMDDMIFRGGYARIACSRAS